MIDYLNRLDELPRIVVVDDLSLTTGGDGVGDGAGAATLSASVTARMFTTAMPDAVAGGASAVATTTTTTEAQ